MCSIVSNYFVVKFLLKSIVKKKQIIGIMAIHGSMHYYWQRQLASCTTNTIADKAQLSYLLILAKQFIFWVDSSKYN